jgi:hypothetical protein
VLLEPIRSRSGQTLAWEDTRLNVISWTLMMTLAVQLSYTWSPSPVGVTGLGTGHELSQPELGEPIWLVLCLVGCCIRDTTG